ncbi:hypothetical protein UlMin_012766 [Ulmus minor]
MEIPRDHFSYVSTPTSPNIDNMYFYSAPTSPREELYGSSTEPTPPRTYEDAYSDLDIFEFETSHRFDIIEGPKPDDIENYNQENQHNQQTRRRGDSLPTMAFADELFCDGKVVPLAVSPLKLPPSFSHGKDKDGTTRSTAVSPPRSPRSVLKLPFSRRSFWNDDFDPFMVAMEKVKKEEKGKMEGKNHRRGRSLSPFSGPLRSSESLDQPNRPKQEGQSPLLPEPKGVLIARRVRRAKIDQEKPIKLDSKVGPGPTKERPKMVTSLVRSLSVGKGREKRKVKNQNAGSWMQSFMRRLRFKSTRDEDKKEFEVDKTTLVQYRPRLYLCLGYGTKYAQ